MRVYITQHGAALDEAVDPARPLSDDGKTAVRGMAQRLQREGITIASAVHSAKTRARETAEIYADVMDIAQVYHADGIKPMDDPMAMVPVINNWKEDTLIASHMPLVSRLTSCLTHGHSDVAYDFQPGAILCLQRAGGQYQLQWFYTESHHADL